MYGNFSPLILRVCANSKAAIESIQLDIKLFVFRQNAWRSTTHQKVDSRRRRSYLEWWQFAKIVAELSRDFWGANGWFYVLCNWCRLSLIAYRRRLSDFFLRQTDRQSDMPDIKFSASTSISIWTTTGRYIRRLRQPEIRDDNHETSWAFIKLTRVLEYFTHELAIPTGYIRTFQFL